MKLIIDTASEKSQENIALDMQKTQKIYPQTSTDHRRPPKPHNPSILISKNPNTCDVYAEEKDYARIATPESERTKRKTRRAHKQSADHK